MNEIDRHILREARLHFTQTCRWCDERVEQQDPRVSKEMQPMHRECFLREVGGSVGHQQKRCSCYGGTEDDPPGMTKREAAEAAAYMFLRSHRT